MLGADRVAFAAGWAALIAAVSTGSYTGANGGA
jgi:hypothetical protein